jgi:uroporphyrinogen-III synthase
VAEGLLEGFPAPPAGGGRVLLATAEAARAVLPEGLAAAGWDVEVVDAYRTVPVTPDAATLDAVAGADAVTFTSSSTVTNFCSAVDTDRVPPVVASIGPVTSATARELGLTVTTEASPHTVDALVDALVAALAPTH